MAVVVERGRGRREVDFPALLLIVVLWGAVIALGSNLLAQIAGFVFAFLLVKNIGRVLVWFGAAFAAIVALLLALSILGALILAVGL